MAMYSKTGTLDVSDDTKYDTVAIVNDGWKSYVMWENNRVKVRVIYIITARKDPVGL